MQVQTCLKKIGKRRGLDDLPFVAMWMNSEQYLQFTLIVIT